MQRIIIIGAGLIGAALAYRLTEAGAAMTVIEAAQPASGAAGASFGWINASFCHSAAHFNLRQAGLAAHHRLSDQVGQTGIRWPGTLWWEEEGELTRRLLAASGARVWTGTAVRGIEVAAIVAELLTAEIVSGDVSPLLAQFRPRRFF